MASNLSVVSMVNDDYLSILIEQRSRRIATRLKNLSGCLSWGNARRIICRGVSRIPFLSRLPASAFIIILKNINHLNQTTVFCVAQLTSNVQKCLVSKKRTQRRSLYFVFRYLTIQIFTFFCIC